MNAGYINDLLSYMPSHIRSILDKLPDNMKNDIEEIRLRVNRPLMAEGCNKEYFLGRNGLESNYNNFYIVNQEDIKAAVHLISNFSLYSVEDEIRNGYITINGGHRIGLSGRAVVDNSKVRTIKDISFLNYRVAKQIIGAADKIAGYIIRSPDTVYNTLIISPPQCGKTTLLRDLIRQLSDGIVDYSFQGKKIALIDERNEIAACCFGKPRNDIGVRTDVMDSCPKAEGIIMMIRSMSPEIIATDEIGRREDAEAILDAINAGVKVITTIHGNDLNDFLKKNSLEKLNKNLFERIIIMSRRKGVGTIEKIYDEEYCPIYSI